VRPVDDVSARAAQHSMRRCGYCSAPGAMITAVPESHNQQ
jgi:hypothetical protein